MEKLIKILVVLFFAQSNGQTIFKDNFLFESTNVEYNSIGGKFSKGKFYIIIKDSDVNKLEFDKKIKNCLNRKKNKYNYYYLIIPKDFSNKKEELVLEFIKDILGKRKLLDSEMNIFSDKNYFEKYEEKRQINHGKYNHVYLNKINSLTFFKENNNICDFLN